MRDRFMNFMAGRHGLDALGRFTLIAAVVIMVVNMFLGIGVLDILEWVLLIITIFRMFSKDNSKRAQENETYMEYSAKVKNWFNGKRRIEDKQKNNGQQNQSGQQNASGQYNQYNNGQADQTGTQQDEAVCIFVCPQCGAKLRVPKGKGKIQITCPVCGESFIETS